MPRQSGIGPVPDRYRLLVTTRFVRDVKRLHDAVASDVRAAVRGLVDDPRPDGMKKLRGSRALRHIRVGKYRVINAIGDTELRILALTAGPRKDVYRNLPKRADWPD